MTATELKSRLESLIEGTRAEVTDLTGTQDHWQAVIVSPAFVGKSRVEQHKMVFDLLKSEVESNEVHALTIRTFTPDKNPLK